MTAETRQRVRLLAVFAAMAWWCVVQPAPVTAQPAGSCTATVLTLAEAAILLRVEAESLQRLAERGGVPGRRIGDSWRSHAVSAEGATWKNS